MWTISFLLERDMAMPMASADASGGTGEGGSLARFKIVGEHLYAVDSHNINIFDIEDLDAPQTLPSIFAGFDIETIFNRGASLLGEYARHVYI